VTERRETEKLLRGLYAARLRGDLAGVCDAFSPDARFRISGPSNASLLAMSAHGSDQLRPLLAIMIKSFKLNDLQILALLIDGANAAVHWRVKIFSRLTGETVVTELIDVIAVHDGRIASFTELFAPA